MKRASVMAGLALAAAAGQVSAQPLADRYGPMPSPQAPAAQPVALPAPANSGVRGRMLEWPGKTLRQAPPQSASTLAPHAPQALRRYAGAAPAADPPASRWSGPARPNAMPAYAAYRTSSAFSAHEQPVYAQPAYAQPAYARAAYAEAERTPPAATAPRLVRGQVADQDGWRPVYSDGGPVATATPVSTSSARLAMSATPPSSQADPKLAGAPTPPALPTSIYTPASSPQPMSPERRAASLPPPRGYVQRLTPAERADDQGVHFYSVHRAFGLQPDPAPIPPQFFTATADLSDPPGPLPTERSTASSKTGVSVHATPDTSTN